MVKSFLKFSQGAGGSRPYVELVASDRGVIEKDLRDEGYTYADMDSSVPDAWWDAFLGHFVWDPTLPEKELKGAFVSHSRDFYGQMLNEYKQWSGRNRGKAPPAVGDERWAKWKEAWQHPDYVERARKNSQNRMKEKHPGSGPSKHYGGSKSSISLAKDIEKTEGRPAYAYEVFYKLHRKPDGSFSDPHSTQIDALYQSRLAKATASSNTPEDIDRDAIFYDVAKTRKGAFGTGLLGKALASKSSQSARSSASQSAMRSQLRDELLGEVSEQMETRVEEAVRSRVEDALQSRVDEAVRATQERMEADIRTRMEAEMKMRMDAEMERMRELVRQLAQPPPPADGHGH
ncbi:hypothetical protein CASFOL_037296 [Castilleja foliolosa]|uniref:Uncharacterized protein n=1 Tax=Castilleja foliolosa TaxID=1961234 RepID=A0ABD3BMZ1_9LAMI